MLKRPRSPSPSAAPHRDGGRVKTMPKRGRSCPTDEFDEDRRVEKLAVVMPSDRNPPEPSYAFQPAQPLPSHSSRPQRFDGLTGINSTLAPRAPVKEEPIDGLFPPSTGWSNAAGLASTFTAVGIQTEPDMSMSAAAGVGAFVDSEESDDVEMLQHLEVCTALALPLSFKSVY